MDNIDTPISTMTKILNGIPVLEIHEKWIWLSRHEMTAEQIAGLKSELENWRKDYPLPVTRDTEEVRSTVKADMYIDIVPQIEVKNLVWETLIPEASSNVATWIQLFADYDRVLGVFPPAALEALAFLREGVRDHGLYEGFSLDETAFALRGRVWSPVSRQDKTTRADGTAAIEFHHVRWARL